MSSLWTLFSLILVQLIYLPGSSSFRMRPGIISRELIRNPPFITLSTTTLTKSLHGLCNLKLSSTTQATQDVYIPGETTDASSSNGKSSKVKVPRTKGEERRRRQAKQQRRDVKEKEYNEIWDDVARINMFLKKPRRVRESLLTPEQDAALSAPYTPYNVQTHASWKKICKRKKPMRKLHRQWKRSLYGQSQVYTRAFLNKLRFKEGNDGIFESSRSLHKAVRTWYIDREKGMKLYGNISEWDVSRVTDMSMLFANMHNFNDDIHKWNTSAVTNMKYMFSNCHTFNQPLQEWDISQVENMEHMFFNTTSFNQPLNRWNTSQVRSMACMFSMTKAFNQPLSDWDVSNVENMDQMFFASKAFNQPLSSWKVNEVKNMRKMFYGAEAFNQPLNSWNVSKVRTMMGMFGNTTAFNQPLSQWSLQSIESLARMFDGAKAFNQFLGDWDMSHVQSLSRMFANTKTFNQPLNMFEHWQARAYYLEDITDMFDGAMGGIVGREGFGEMMKQWPLKTYTWNRDGNEAVNADRSKDEANHSIEDTMNDNIKIDDEASKR